MKNIKQKEYDDIVKELKGKTVERPNKSNNGTLSGHAAGEPFEKFVYHILKQKYPNFIYKQHEFLNDLYLRNPKYISLKDRQSLFDSPVALFLLNRSDKATASWNPANIFEEKQDDTADILWHNGNYYFDIIDIKTRNIAKIAMPPNIISAYKLAKTCALMLDNNDYSSVDIHYIEIDWKEDGENLKCVDAHWKNLFLSNPQNLYINWAEEMQIQFHVENLDQSFDLGNEIWAKEYLHCFVNSAKRQCKKMY